MSIIHYDEDPEASEACLVRALLSPSAANFTMRSPNAVIAIRAAVNSICFSSFDSDPPKVASRNASKKATNNHVPMNIRRDLNCQYIYKRQCGHTG